MQRADPTSRNGGDGASPGSREGLLVFAPYGADPEDLRERIVESQGRRQESVEFPGFQAAQSEYPSVSDEGDALFMDTVLAAIGVETFSNAETGCSNSVSSTASGKPSEAN